LGLGLASSSLICQALGGLISLEKSEVNKGTTFKFFIKTEISDDMKSED
jgi:signal transduction histidine kinase